MIKVGYNYLCYGEVTEWLKVPLSKSGVLARVPRVRIHPSPPFVIIKSMSDSIFTRIIKGEIPAYKIYEDEKTLAFLDIHPVQPGHTLVVPKEQIEFVWDLPDELYQAVMATSKKVALRLRDLMGTKYVSERIVGIDVPHAHVQLIPFNEVSELRAQPDMNAEPDHEALAQMTKRLAF